MVSARSIRAGAAFVELTVKDSQLAKGLKRARARLKAFSAGVSDLGKKLLGISAIAAAPLALSARVFGGFSDKMAEVRAVTGATEDDFRALTEEAKQLGRTTSFTARQVAEGMTELGRAGYSATEILSAIPGVLDLARGTATGLGRAAEIAAMTMRGFNLAAKDTPHIVDVLVRSANKSATTLPAPQRRPNTTLMAAFRLASAAILPHHIGARPDTREMLNTLTFNANPLGVLLRIVDFFHSAVRPFLAWPSVVSQKSLDI